MAGEWRASTWGEEISLEYGKALRDHDEAQGRYRVFGSNGPIGWTSEPLAAGPGVVLGRKGAYRGVQYSPEPFFVIDTAYYVVPKSELDMRWLYYAIKHYKLGEVDDGSPIPSTTRAAVYMLDMDVPPLPEQRAIAHILGTLDDKIELNRRMNETLEAMARALFKSWFVDFDPIRAKAEGRARKDGARSGQPRKPLDVASDLPWPGAQAGAGAKGDPGLPKPLADLFPDSFEGSELGEIPKGFEVRALYDCADYINGSTFRNDDFSQDRVGLPVIKIGELKDGITSQTKFTEAILEPKYRITSGDILFSWSGSPDTSIDTFVWTGGEGWLNQHIFKMQFNRPEEKFFVHFLLRHLKPMFIEIARNKQTTGLGHVTAQDLKRLKTVFPPDDILRAFNRLAESLFQKAYSNSCESRTLATLRDTLLPKLISGELRLPDVERIIGGRG